MRRLAVTPIPALLVFAALALPARAQEGAPPAPIEAVKAGVAAQLARPDLDPVARMQLDLYNLINQRRAEAGLPPLLLDARLVASAGEHAADMAAGRFCRHTGRDGSNVRARMRKHGYPFNNWAGENIICSRRTPQAAMAWWLNSGPHRRNILHGHYTHIGIGIDPNGPYGPMWTLNFGAGAADHVMPPLLSQPPVQMAEAPPAEQAPAEQPAQGEQAPAEQPAPAAAAAPPADAGKPAAASTGGQGQP